jgi:acyl-CoA thioester hydrolase
VVYHANYLRFMERARSEWLSHLGLEHGGLAQDHDVLFVVRTLQIDYLRPAKLGDLLTVEVAVFQVRRSVIVFRQRILRGEECLNTGEVSVVSVSAATFRPRALPEPVMAVLRPWIPDTRAA